MNEIKVNTWDAFLIKQKELAREYQEKQDATLSSPRVISDLLYRGQRLESWKLETTLQRWAGDDIKVLDYHLKLMAIQAEFESRSNKRWNVIDTPQVRSKLQKDNGMPSEDFHDLIRENDLYSYMAHLRHHGFPSPLLDWTRSPYVAAYFAFEDAVNDDLVAIYVYCEWAGGTKGGYVGRERFESLGQHVRTHTRHFTQQAEYTLALKGHGLGLSYCDHDQLSHAKGSKGSDMFWKFVIPGIERKNALAYLQKHNINAFTLFGNEESLAKSLAIKEFILKQ